jgi:thiamine biosynthesis lipoprotein
MALDLGGVAKGWAVDAAADVAAARWGNCLVNVGGDLTVRGTKPGGRPWVIGVQDPRDPGAIFAKLALPPGMAVATSGDYQRNFEVDGVIYHHLLDPATGRPARGANSATVVATTCALADAWATAAFVLGAEDGIRLLEAMPTLEGILVVVNEAGELVVRETSGMPAYRVD